MKKITKVIIPAAGMGTRLLPATKEQPKEMLPIFGANHTSNLEVKPIIQAIFELLFECGLRDFYFIVGRSKRALEDHFTPDYDFLERLGKKNKKIEAKSLNAFYRKIESSHIGWINQPSPKGFGHAVLLAKNFIGDEPFFVHAGDTIILSKQHQPIQSLLDNYAKEKNQCVLLVRKVPDPKPYGVINSDNVKSNVINVKEIEEKPEKPKSNLAVMPLYIFEPSIFTVLKNTKPGKGNEIQLTDGIKNILKNKSKVVAIKMKNTDLWIDVGSPETYWLAQSSTYDFYKK